ncbi:putative ribonuclease H-like domain-containing protein [Tanacetum coccineum]
MNIWKVIQNGNSLKRTGRDRDGRVIILPPTTTDEHIVVQRESKARTTLLQSIPNDYVADFHYMDDVRDIWNTVKARFGGNAESKDEKVHAEAKYSESLPSSWSQDTLKIDIKEILLISSSQSPSHSVFGSTTSTSKKMSYAESPSFSSSTTYSAPSSSKSRSHSSNKRSRVMRVLLQKYGMAAVVADCEEGDAEVGKVTFGGGEGRITGKGTIRTPKLDFENVYYVKELQQFNLFSVSQICDKKNRVLFIDTDCLVLSNDFKLPDESIVLLRVPRKHNLYTFNLNNLAPKENLACKQHKATYKAITVVRSIYEPLQLLHMDLFGPTSIRSIDHKYYCLLITDDYSRFCWVFFLETKDKTYSILKDFISLVENQLNKNVKAIRCDNGTEFKNAKLIELCGEKGIKRDYSNARTPQQSRVTERKNRTLIEALNYDHLGKFNGKADEGYLFGYSAIILNKSLNQSAVNMMFLYNPAAEPKDTSDAHSNGVLVATAEDIFQQELARLKDQEQIATFAAERLGLGFAKDAEELQKRASAKTVPPGSIPVPTSRILVPSVPFCSFFQNDSFFDDEPTTRFSNPSDLVNNVPSPGIFSSTSYDDEFGADLNNLASTVEVHKKTTGETAFLSYIQDQQRNNQTFSIEEGIDYDEVFALVARIEAIILFLAFASYMGFMVYQMDVKSEFLYGSIDEEILKKFDLESVKTATTPYEAPKPKSKEEHIIRIGMYTCNRSIDSDYAGANKDRKSTTGGCQFLGRRLISWQCKKQTIVATSSTEAEYVAAANCCGQVPPAITILATIDETPYTITEDSVRSQLQLADDGGIDDLPIADIYSGMDNLGYVTEGKLTFYKNKFSPQWRFLVHTILHCLSTKSGSWDQFGSSLAVALICLSDGRKFNWSSYIFKGMVSNIGNAKKFLMYPRFLQTILGIETSVASQYRVFKLSSKLFANMKLNFEGQPMPLLAAMLSQAQAGEGAGVAAQAVPPPIPETIPETRPEPDQPQDHLSTPPRQQTSDPIAPVFEHGQSSDPNIASFSRAHDPDDEPFTSTNVEDEPLGGSFHASPPRSTQAPPTGHTSGGAEDLITLTALSSVVSTLVQKVNSLETELKAHKKLFKDVVGKLVKKVKAMEAKLKPKKRKVVVSDSDQDEGGEQTVDLDALIALANAAVTVDSNIPPGGASNNPAASSHIPTDVPTGGDFAPAHSTSPSRDPFKRKGIAKPSSHVSEKTKKQLADERPSEIEAARLEALERERSEKEKAEIARQDAIYAKQLEQEVEMSASQRETRQAEVLSSAKHYSDADWIDIMAQVHANAGLSSELLGADVNDDNFAERSVCIIASNEESICLKTKR